MNRTEQNRTEQNRTEQNRTEQNRTEQNRRLSKLKKIAKLSVCAVFAAVVVCGVFFSLGKTLLSAFFAISLLVNGAAFYKFYLQKKSKVNTILVNSGVVVSDKSKTENHKSGIKVHNQKNDELNILFVGNSLTLHPFADYWWTLCGMAASREDKDYVHITCNLLLDADTLDGKKISKVNFTACNFASWEVMAHDRAETLPLIEQFLSNKLDYIIIQLGENISDAKTLKSDFEHLIEYIEEHTGADSEKIAVGTFFLKESVDATKKSVCQARNIKCADLTDMVGIEKWMASAGTKVYDKTGNEHVIEHNGVTLHPGDAGMEEIARRIVHLMNEE